MPTLVFQETKVHKTTSKRTGSRVKMPTHSEQFRIWVNEIKYKITQKFMVPTPNFMALMFVYHYWWQFLYFLKYIYILKLLVKLS